MIRFNYIYGADNLSEVARSIKHNTDEKILPNSNKNLSEKRPNICFWGPQDSDSVIAIANHITGNYHFTDNGYFRFVEAIIPLPHPDICPHDYYSEVLHWCLQRFGVSNVILMEVHLDEGIDHCHVLFIPRQTIYHEWGNPTPVGLCEISTQSSIDYINRDFQGEIGCEWEKVLMPTED